MKTRRLLINTTAFLVGIGLAMFVTFVNRSDVNAAIGSPAIELLLQSFSVNDGDPLTKTGVHAADILIAGGIPRIPCANLGLLCADSASGVQDDVRALSFGNDLTPSNLPFFQFSVGRGSQGAPNTAVRLEANCNPAEPHGDVFESSLNQSNLQELDANGSACGSNSGFGLLINEGAVSDNVDALADDPCRTIDLDCDGVPDAPIFLTLAPNSPSLLVIGASAADILMTANAQTPWVWARGTTNLGLQSGDAIDGMCVRENGNGVYDSGDLVLFSLAPGSPTLASLSASPATLFRPSPLRAVVQPTLLGLWSTDNVDALRCGFVDLNALFRLEMPLIIR